MKTAFSVLLVLIIFACGKKIVPVAEKKSEVSTAYSEDLTEFRVGHNEIVESEASNNKSSVGETPPPITTQPLNVNAKIDAILEQKAAKNKAIKYANGFRIQIYVGSERKLVDEAKVYIYQTYPNFSPYLTFNLPIYKLKVGDFLTKTDAERVLSQLKGQFPDAIIIPERIDVKKSFLRE